MNKLPASPYLFRDAVDHCTLRTQGDPIATAFVDSAFPQPIPTLEDEHPWLVYVYVAAGIAAVLLSAAYPYWMQP